MMTAYEVSGSVSVERARELVDNGDWTLHGLVWDRGRVRSVIRNRVYPEVLVVDEPDPHELPQPWSSPSYAKAHP
jgi:hypothetical protein